MKRIVLILFLQVTYFALAQCPNNDNTDTDGDGVADCIDPCTMLANSIIGNTSFESDFVGWTIPQNPANFAITQDPQHILDGINALYITAPNTSQFENHAIYSEEFILEEGIGYSFRIPAKRIGNNEGDALRWALVDENGVYRHLNNYYDWTEDWSTISINNLQIDLTNFPSNRFRLRLEFGLSQTDMVVDRIAFYETTQGFDPTYQDNNNDGIVDCGDFDASTHLDYGALVDLYNETNGDNWPNNTNWLNINIPLSEWHGVSMVNNRVTRINLRNNNLSGTLPVSLDNLIELTFIDFALNDLSGGIPTELGNLSQLQWLDLAQNQLTGSIPSSLTNLTELTRLSVASNQLNGPIPDFTGQNLFVLAFDFNYFQFGDFEDEFTQYQSNIAQFLYTPQYAPASIVNPIVLDTGESTTLTSEPISGVNNLYQWYYNFQPISGATSPEYTITNFQGSQSGTYFCRVSNSVITDLFYEVGLYNVGLIPSSHPDYNALVDFYNSTNGDNWSNNYNWLNDTQPISNWTGITEENGRVTAISLQQNNLSGFIPETFSNLTELKTFNIRLNNVNGSFPLASFTNQTQLEYVDVNSNFMTGFIPPEIANLTNLWHLDIGWNGFNGAIPPEITNLNNLQNLYLHNNQFSGTIPSGPGTMPNLQILFLANNNLSGAVPDLSGLPSLFYLDITSNKFIFSDIEPSYNNLNFQLGSNYVYAPQQFIDEEKGFVVDIGNTITLTSLPNLGTNLTIDWYAYDGVNYTYKSSGNTFDLTVNSESDYGDYIYYVTSSDIPFLGLQSQAITIGPDPQLHPDYNALIALYNALDGSNWVDPWDITAPIETWDSSYRLTFDDITNRVTIFEYGNAGLSGILPPEIGELTELETFFVFGNDIQGDIPAEFWNLTNLKTIILGHNPFSLTNGIPPEISNLQNLEWLNLTNIPLPPTLQPEIFNLPNLIRLRVVNCGLTGTIPAEFAMIDDIFADGNNFEGTIPDEILNVNGNTRLSITNNFFDFSDLEPLAQSNGYQFLNYSPQRTQDEEESVESGEGADITLTVNDTNLNRSTSQITAENNNYQWFKDAVAITGATETSYTIFNAQTGDSGVYHCEITNTSLPDLTIVRAPITLLVDESLGLDDFSDSNFKLYPNPAQHWINISSVHFNDAKLSIYDINGRQLIHKIINGTTNALNIEELQTGTYILLLEESGTTKSKRFIKQ